MSKTITKLRGALQPSKDTKGADYILNLLKEGETIHSEWTAIKDRAIFTSSRIFILNKSMLGSKVKTTVLKFEDLENFSNETTGAIGMSSDLELGFRGGIELELKFLRGVDHSSVITLVNSVNN